MDSSRPTGAVMERICTLEPIRTIVDKEDISAFDFARAKVHNRDLDKPVSECQISQVDRADDASDRTEHPSPCQSTLEQPFLYLAASKRDGMVSRFSSEAGETSRLNSHSQMDKISHHNTIDTDGSEGPIHARQNSVSSWIDIDAASLAERTAENGYAFSSPYFAGSRKTMASLLSLPSKSRSRNNLKITASGSPQSSGEENRIPRRSLSTSLLNNARMVKNVTGERLAAVRSLPERISFKKCNVAEMSPPPPTIRERHVSEIDGQDVNDFIPPHDLYLQDPAHSFSYGPNRE